MPTSTSPFVRSRPSPIGRPSRRSYAFSTRKVLDAFSYASVAAAAARGRAPTPSITAAKEAAPKNLQLRPVAASSASGTRSYDMAAPLFEGAAQCRRSDQIG